MMFYRRVLFSIAIVVTVLQLVIPQEQYQYNVEAERVFAVALQKFQLGSFNESAVLFDQLIKLKPTHQRTTAAYIMSAKSHFQVRNYGISAARAFELLNAFPTTSYRSDGYYVLGLNDMMRQKYGDAAQKFLKARSATKDTVLAREALSYIELIISDRLNTQELTTLYRETTEREMRDLLALTLAEKYTTTGDALHANEMLSAVSQGKHSVSFDKRIQKLQQHLTTHGVVNIGVLLPTSSSSSSDQASTLSNEVLDGIQYALEEYKSGQHSVMNVSLEIRKINGDPASMIQVQELASSNDVIGIIGPLFSNQALACGSLADAGRIPMISPTANANGIAAKSKYTFQANPDVSTRGKAIARYAAHTLGLTKLAVITSDNQQSKILADEFAREAKLLGAEIVAFETYSKDSSDLREQFMRIREAGATEEPSISFAVKFTRAQLKNMVRAGADSDVLSEARKKKQTVPVTKLFGPRGKVIVDSLHLPFITSVGEAYNIDVPVTGIQGIFAAIGESEEMGVIASQMSYFNVNAQLLGSGEWHDAVQLEANKPYVDGALFLSDSYVDKNDPLYNAFEQSYLRSKKKPPTRNTLYGYDTMKLLLRHIEQGVTTREQLAHALENEKEYRGIHATITLLRGRVNSNVHILKFKNNEIIRVAEVNVN